MAFGGRADAKLSAQLVQVFLERGHDEVDTAYMYNDGQAESIIGDMQLPKTGRVLSKQTWMGRSRDVARNMFIRKFKGYAVYTLAYCSCYFCKM